MIKKTPSPAVSKFMSSLKERQEFTQPPHLIIQALAGTGKTSTLVEGLKVLAGQTPRFTPSEEQQAIWESMLLSKKAESFAFVAFNSSVAEELKSQVPSSCEAMTNHQLGNRAIKSAYGKLKLDTKGYRVLRQFCQVYGTSVEKILEDNRDMVSVVKNVFALCKLLLIDKLTPDLLEEICETYCFETDLEINQAILNCFDETLALAKTPEKDGWYDFNDMIWLPVVNDLPLTKYDLLLVDESQDLNACQQELVKRSGSRLILVGDEHQAIYGFAGADSSAMKHLRGELESSEQGCDVLSLTMTRRCGKAIVKEAQSFVPEYKAHESNPEGKISYMNFDTKDYRNFVVPGDRVICRLNAPLIGECFKLMKLGHKVHVLGRDLGKVLKKRIKLLMQGVQGLTSKQEIETLISKVREWSQAEIEKEEKRKKPREGILIMIQDREECLINFAINSSSIKDVLKRIDEVFDDSTSGGILLSTIHKVKGLESNRVFFIEPKGATVPHPMAKSKDQIAAENNLRYIAQTRAIRELVYVHHKNK